MVDRGQVGKICLLLPQVSPNYRAILMWLGLCAKDLNIVNRSHLGKKKIVNTFVGQPKEISSMQ